MASLHLLITRFGEMCALYGGASEIFSLASASSGSVVAQNRKKAIS